MNKEQKIKEAWLKIGINELEHIEGNQKLGWRSNSGVKYDTWDGRFEVNNLFHRPKELTGIEYNNGWIKIESEADLPEQGGEYTVFRMSKKSTATYCKNDRWMIPENDYPKTTFQHGITHYRKKEIIPNPIY